MKKLKAIPVDSGTQVHINTSDIPAHVAMNLAQAIFEAIHLDFQRPEIWSDYERWKSEKRVSIK